MALVSQRVSDVSGKTGKDEDFVTVVIRSGLGVEKPVAFDALRSELNSLKQATGFIELDIKDNGATRTVIVAQPDFDKIVKDVPALLAAARSTRGRQAGWSPKNKA